MHDAIQRLRTRLAMIVSRGRVKMVNDSGPVQTLQLQVSDDELIDSLPRLIEYGFTSVPLTDSDVVAVFLGGERSNGVAIASGHQTARPTGLQAGETMLYDDQGQQVYISRSGIRIVGTDKPVDVTTTGDVTINAASATVTTTGDLTADVGGDANVTASGSATVTATAEITLSAPTINLSCTNLNIDASAEMKVTCPPAVHHSPTGGVQFSGAINSDSRNVQTFT